MRVVDLQLEQRVVLTALVVRLDRGELLVGRHERRRDVVCQEHGVSVDVQELNDIAVSNNSASPRLGQFFGRKDLPMVVGVVVRVTGYLLT